MSIVNITDANGKEFELNISKQIMYLNDDMGTDTNKMFSGGITDSLVVTPVELQIVNSAGELFNITDESLSNEIVDIDVYIEASHSDMEINNGFYTGDSMQRDAGSYTAPYKKPFIMNHDVHSEPVGRIIESDCVDSISVEGSKAVNVVAKVADKAAIEKFLDGRYSTVSIGANPKTVSCNHCGKHILKDGNFKFCGHMRGESYDSKKATWKMEDLEYSELSIVNEPADRMAQVYKIKVNTKADLRTSNSSEDENSTINIANKMLKSTVEVTTDSITMEITSSGVVDSRNIMIANLQEEQVSLADEIKVLKVDSEYLNKTLTNMCALVNTMISKVVTLALDEEVDTDVAIAMEQFDKALEKLSVADEKEEITDEEVEETLIVAKVQDPALSNANDPVVIAEETNSLEQEAPVNNETKGQESSIAMLDNIFALYK